MAVAFDRIVSALNRSEATRVAALDIKVFNRVWQAGLLYELKPYGISGQVFGLISSFLNNSRLLVVPDRTCSQVYPVKVPQGSILDPTLFLLYINNPPVNVICHIAFYADDATV